MRLTGPVVTLIVEDGDASYNVHERLLRPASAFFDKALSGSWMGSQTCTVRLPDDQRTTFGLYVHWLYYNSLPCGWDDQTEEYLNLAQAYVFGDKTLDNKFQDTILDTMIKRARTIGDSSKTLCAPPPT
ncbi:hypothetical protein BJX65DRAFT_301466 [Aspergillus insuetus]